MRLNTNGKAVRSDAPIPPTARRLGGLVALAAAALLGSATVQANHTVLVEGEADFDGDGLIGMEESGDGDQVFGTITDGIGGVSDNGRVLIVTSGRFFEQVVLLGAGVSVLEAAPGVEAVVEAFNGGGEASANNTRQQQPGIIIDTDGSFPIEVRNITSRNWTVGIKVSDRSRVTIDDVRLDSNVNYGIQVMDNARVAITDSNVNSSGYRKSGSLGATPGGDIQPHPGNGIHFQNRSRGVIRNTTVAHNFGVGIRSNGHVHAFGNTVFNNGRDYRGFRRR